MNFLINLIHFKNPHRRKAMLSEKRHNARIREIKRLCKTSYPSIKALAMNELDIKTDKEFEKAFEEARLGRWQFVIYYLKIGYKKNPYKYHVTPELH